MRVSVIVINFNGVSWLHSCLTSVTAQKLDPSISLEVILVDNGSEDESVEFVRQLDLNILIVESPVNVGFASGCNLGIRAATGEVVVLLNNDTRLDEGAIQNLFEEMRDRKLDVIAAVEVPYDGGVFEPRRTLIDPLGYAIIRKPSSHGGKGSSFFLSAACVMLEKTTYWDSGGLDTSFFMYYEDVDWFWRLTLYGYRFDYSSKTGVNHFVTGSAHGLKFDYKRFLWRNCNQPRILLKNYRAPTLLFIFPVFCLNYLFEAVVLLAMGRKDLARSYISALPILFRNREGTLRDRGVVQRRRTIGDREILFMMYPGLASASGLWERAKSIKNRSA